MLTRISIAAMALLTVWSLPARADRDRPPEPEARARMCVYEKDNYGGEELCFAGGEDVADLGRFRNHISSVRILGRGQVVLYDHRDFRGRELVVTSDTPSLRAFGWDDDTDSLRVTAFRGSRDRRDDERDYDRDYGRDHGRDDERRDEYRDEQRSFGEDRVCFYQHANFRGDSKCWDLRDEVSELDSSGWNNRISSIRVFGHTHLEVFERKHYHGARLVVEGDIADLTQVHDDQGGNWNDRISSFRVSGERR